MTMYTRYTPNFFLCVHCLFQFSMYREVFRFLQCEAPKQVHVPLGGIPEIWDPFDGLYRMYKDQEI